MAKLKLHIVLLLGLFTVGHGNAQSYLGLRIGAGGGWWLQESLSHVGTGVEWDRSHFNFNLPVEVSFEKKLGKRFQAGIVTFFSAVQDQQIVKSTDQSYDPDRTRISDGWFTTLGGGLKGHYAVVQGNRFDLSGTLQVGFFHLNTSHPDEQGFRQKFYFQVGPKLTLKGKQWNYSFSPSYSEFSFENAYANDRKNKMYFLNFMLGIHKKIGK